jgi:hypothetical protein
LTAQNPATRSGSNRGPISNSIGFPLEVRMN